MDLSSQNLRIDSSRLSLRTLEESAVAPYYVGWLNNKDVNTFLESRFTVQTEKSVRSFGKQTFNSHDSMLFGIFLHEKGTHIGNIKLGTIDNHHSTSRLGFVIGESSAWGLGYATEAISCISQWAFSEVHLSKLTAGCYEQNIGSKRALEKSGFVQEAILKNQVIDSSGNRQDILKFARHAL